MFDIIYATILNKDINFQTYNIFQSYTVGPYTVSIATKVFNYLNE